jgi:predicted regulator of Ras-like GTPase activity (Roadblock/LC7/MglB family)
MGMTFREILQSLVDQTPGALAAAVMAGDGVAIDEYARPGTNVDLGSIAIEFGRIFHQSQKVADALSGSRDGALQEMLLVTGANQVFFRQLDEDSFLVLALDATGLIGKARYLTRTLLQEIREAL